MKRVLSLILCFSFLTLCACSEQPQKAGFVAPEGAVQIILSDEGITADGAAVTSDESAAVWAANDIVYYPEGKDFTFGEGSAGDEHSAEEANAHTVVHIGKAGTYVLSGTLSAGQIAIDLGDGAEDDPSAVVNLILNGVDITCTVAPGIIFYEVYECGSADAETATAEVDTAKAGANLILAEGSENTVRGSYVARIYKEGTVELSEDGTEVLDAKKKHKYDAAVYSKMSMNVSGGGSLYIDAENEGLDTELHLTILSGEIRIESGNDGINTNEDGVSVTRISGGTVDILVTGETGEGDGIDSNGWLILDGGTVRAQACATSGDAGIDSDMGITIGTGSTVIATGSMLDRIETSEQNYCVFTFAAPQPGGNGYSLTDKDGKEIAAFVPDNAFSILVVSAPELTAGEYSLSCDGTKLSVAAGENFGGMGGFGGGMRPDGQIPPEGERPEWPEDETPQRPEGETPPMGEGETPPEMPEGEVPPNWQPGDGARPDRGQGGMGGFGKLEGSEVFSIADGANYFTVLN